MSRAFALFGVLLCITVAGVAAGCGLTPAGSVGAMPPAEPAGGVMSPDPFRDEFDGAMAVAGNTLWLAKTGLDGRDQVRTRVLSYRAGKWKKLGGSARSTTGTRLLLAAYHVPGSGRAVPCTAFTARGGIARVRCFQGGKWQVKPIPAKWRRSYPVGLSTVRGRLTLVMQKNRSHGSKSSSQIQAFRLNRRGFDRVGRGLRIGTQVVTSVASAGLPGRNRALQLGVVSVPDPAFRQIFTLRSGRWKAGRKLTGLVGGAGSSGPARVGSMTYFAVNQSDWDKTFEFSVWASRSNGRWSEVSGKPLNQGFGHAQGGVFPIGKQVWAIWSEFASEGLEFGDWFPVETYVARIRPGSTSIGDPVRLWNGNLVFSVAEEVVAYHGKPVFLYMRQFRRKGGMKVTVDFRRVKAIKK